MNITPITKKYTTLANTANLSFGSTKKALKTQENLFCCPKTIVKDTLNEFSNSRGNYLADIDLADIYIRDYNNALANQKRIIVKNTPNRDIKNIHFLADMDLADAFELPKKKANVSFKSSYPTFLADDYVVESYSTTSDAIEDIAQSTYCSFGAKKEESFVTKFFNLLRKYI